MDNDVTSTLVSSALGAVAESVVRQLPVNATLQRQIIYAMKEHGTMTQHQLCQLLGRTHSNIGPSLSALEEKRIITAQHNNNPGRGNATVWELSHPDAVRFEDDPRRELADRGLQELRVLDLRVNTGQLAAGLILLDYALRNVGPHAHKLLTASGLTSAEFMRDAMAAALGAEMERRAAARAEAANPAVESEDETVEAAA